MLPSSCLKRRRSAETAVVRVLCLPWCGAGASVLRSLANQLPPHYEVLTLQLPGREERYKQPLLRRMDALVAHVLDALSVPPPLPLPLPLPLVLFGHSMGAVVAYELAQALFAHGGRGGPQLLIASGHGAPAPVSEDAPQWHRASDAQLIAQLRALGGTAGELLEEAVALKAILPVLRADYEVLETRAHVARHPLPCPIAVCCSTEDRTVSKADLDRWRLLTRSRCEFNWFAGDHFHLHRKIGRAHV